MQQPLQRNREKTFQVVLGQRTINLFSSRSLVYLKTQVIAAGLGVFALIFFTLFDYHTFGNFAKLLYAGSLGLLLLVLLFGDVRNGSKSWLTILGVTFQPAEIVKIVFILAYAKFIEDAQETLNEPLVLLRLLLLAIVPILMVYKQGDLGTASVFFVIAASMLFVAELDKKYIFSFLGMAILSMPVLWSRLDQYQKKSNSCVSESFTGHYRRRLPSLPIQDCHRIRSVFRPRRQRCKIHSRRLSPIQPYGFYFLRSGRSLRLCRRSHSIGTFRHFLFPPYSDRQGVKGSIRVHDCHRRHRHAIFPCFGEYRHDHGGYARYRHSASLYQLWRHLPLNLLRLYRSGAQRRVKKTNLAVLKGRLSRPFLL